MILLLLLSISISKKSFDTTLYNAIKNYNEMNNNSKAISNF